LLSEKPTSRVSCSIEALLCTSSECVWPVDIHISLSLARITAFFKLCLLLLVLHNHKRVANPSAFSEGIDFYVNVLKCVCVRNGGTYGSDRDMLLLLEAYHNM